MELTYTSTKDLIICACKELFYEKGYRETSYDDICAKAHLNRSSVYYYFKEKEALRHAVFKAWQKDFYRLAEKYCDDPDYCYMLGEYLHWERMAHDRKMLSCMLKHYLDYPVFDPEAPPARQYLEACRGMYGPFWPIDETPAFTRATVYGFILSIFMLMDARHGEYTGKELFYHTMLSGTSIWGIPKELIEERWRVLNTYIDRIPPEEIYNMPVY